MIYSSFEIKGWQIKLAIRMGTMISGGNPSRLQQNSDHVFRVLSKRRMFCFPFAKLCSLKGNLVLYSHLNIQFEQFLHIHYIRLLRFLGRHQQAKEVGEEVKKPTNQVRFVGIQQKGGRMVRRVRKRKTTVGFFTEISR